MSNIQNLIEQADIAHQELKALGWNNTSRNVEAQLILLDQDIAKAVAKANAVHQYRVSTGAQEGLDLCLATLYEAVGDEGFRKRRQRVEGFLADRNWNLPLIMGPEYYTICARLAVSKDVDHQLERIDNGTIKWISLISDDGIYTEHCRALLRYAGLEEDIKTLVKKGEKLSKAFKRIGYEQTPKTHSILAEFAQNQAEPKELAKRTDRFREALIETGRSRSLDLTYTALIMTAKNADTEYFKERFTQIFEHLKEKEHNIDGAYMLAGRMAMLPVSVEKVVDAYDTIFSGLQRDSYRIHLTGALVQEHFARGLHDPVIVQDMIHTMRSVDYDLKPLISALTTLLIAQRTAPEKKRNTFFQDIAVDSAVGLGVNALAGASLTNPYGLFAGTVLHRSYQAVNERGFEGAINYGVSGQWIGDSVQSGSEALRSVAEALGNIARDPEAAVEYALFDAPFDAIDATFDAAERAADWLLGG